MRMLTNCLVTTSLVMVAALAAMPSRAADLDATSVVDAVIVYPDGASVTRVVTLDLPAGDNSAVLKDFPLTLDSSSLRVEGDAGAKLTIGSIDARPPRAAPPVNLPELDKRIEALKDERVNLQGAINAATARRKFAERFAEASPAGIGDKGEGASDFRMARRFRSGCRGNRERGIRRSAMPNASSASSIARSRGWSRTRRRNRAPSSKSGSNLRHRPQPRRRCG